MLHIRETCNNNGLYNIENEDIKVQCSNFRGINLRFCVHFFNEPINLKWVKYSVNLYPLCKSLAKVWNNIFKVCIKWVRRCLKCQD